MKRGWMIVLLLSVGLNIGLGLNLLRRQPEAPLPSASAPLAPDDQPDPVRAERFMRHRLDRMTRELDLDEKQQADLWTLHRDVGREVFGRRHAMMEARSRLHEAYGAPEANAETIQATVRRISSMQSDLDSMIVEVMLREREILRPDQRQHYHSLIPMGSQRYPHGLHADDHRGSRRGRRQAQ